MFVGHLAPHRSWRVLLLPLAIACAGFAAGCGGEVAGPAAEAPRIVTLQDGTTLAIPPGAQFFYFHVAVTGPLEIDNFSLTGFDEMVISRIDWSVCNPAAVKVQFASLSNQVIPSLTWRIPTRVTTPLAGINVLGIFSAGGTLEGGLRIDLDGDGPGFDQGVTSTRVVDACAGDWVTYYGYIR